MDLFALPYRVNITTSQLIGKREHCVSAIETNVLVPEFKSLNHAFWYDRHAHCAIRRVRLLVPVLCKPYSYHYSVWNLVVQ